jgi:hypothetical protein
MICPKCGKDDGNYPIWISRSYNGDPPDCYCERIDGEDSPCSKLGYGNCSMSVTMYYHKCSTRDEGRS